MLPPLSSPVPTPRGTPWREPFVVGAAGAFFAAAMAIVYGIAVLTVLFTAYNGFFGIFANPLGVILGTVFSGALLIHLFGLYGLWRNYGSTLAIATFVYGFIAVIVFLLANVLAPFSVQVQCFSYGYCVTSTALWGFLLVLLGLVLLGVLFILEGVSFLLIRRFTGMQNPALAGGIISIVGGSLIVSILMAFLGGFFVAAVALILEGFVLVKAPLPSIPAMAAFSPSFPTAPPPYGSR